MRQMLGEIWREDRRSFVRILLLNILVSLMSGIGIVMLLPMLELLDIGAGATPGLMSKMLSPLQAFSRMEQTFLLMGLYIALITVKALMGRALSLRENAFIEGYSFTLRDRLYRAVCNASWEQLASRKRTDTINLFTAQCSQVSYGIRQIIQLLASFVSTGVQLAIALWMSVPVTAMVIFVGGIFLVLFAPLRKKSRSYGEELIQISRNFYGELLNQLSSVKEVRTYGVEKEHAAEFGRISHSFFDANMRFTRLRATPQVVYSIAAALLIAAVFLFSVLFFHMETARMMVLVLVFSRLWPIFSSLQGRLQGIQSCVPAYEKLREALDEMESEATEMGEGESALSFEKELSFHQVGFTYRGGEKPVLERLNFSVFFGQITALAGRSGAGKSTIADLILGFLRPSTGEIRIDGTALSPETARAWRKQIGYIPQDPLILNASVRENLRRFHPGSTEADMIAALKKSMAWSFIQELPQGLDTVLGDQGVRLSGGERQRVVLARVLMGKPKMIILDEATSALDFESETAIREVLLSLRGQAAILIIAHRLATIRVADRAIVLEGGTVAEAGEWAQLIQQPDGYLARMIHVE